MIRFQENLKLPLLIILLLAFATSYGQENPPIPVNVEVRPANVMNFGSFTVADAGGTLSLDHTGVLTPGPGVTVLNMGAPPVAALFDVYAIPGTILNIQHPDQVILNGTSGDYITLKIDSYSTGKSFVTTAPPTIPNPVFIGGTLYMGNSEINGPGNYSGTLTITFIQQ